MNDTLSGWNEWSKSFDNWKDVTISEIHGIMTGVMVACDPPDAAGWARLLSELSFGQLDEPALQLLTEEAEDVVFQLKDKDDAYGYTPLVPDDDHELYERVMALKDWSSGFITGVGISDITLTDNESETISDLAHIASIRINPEDEFEGGEESFLNLYEFARFVPVMLSVRPRKPVNKLRLIAGLPV